MAERAPNIAYQEVAAAIETLALESTPATVMNIRRVLARNYPGIELRGSPNKVLELLKQYQESNSYEIAFRDSHLSTELIGAMVAETKRHMALDKEERSNRLEAAEADRDQFLHECMERTEERDELRKRISEIEASHANEIKQYEVKMAQLEEQARGWEKDYREAKSSLEKTKELLEGKIGLLAVATEQAKSAHEFKERMDNAEKRNFESFAETQKLNRELRNALNDKAELEKRLLFLEGNQKPSKQK